MLFNRIRDAIGEYLQERGTTYNPENELYVVVDFWDEFIRGKEVIKSKLENAVLSDSFIEVLLVTEDLQEGEQLLAATKCKAEKGEKGFWVDGRAMFDYKITFDDNGEFEEERYSWYGYWFSEFEKEEEEEEDNDTKGENE